MRVVTRHYGVSLVEMLVALTLGLIVLSIVVTVFWNSLGINNRELLTARLVQELRAVTDLMVRDLRRAGFWELSVFAVRPNAGLVLSGSDLAINSSGTDFVGWGLGASAVPPLGLSVVGENGRADITATGVGGSIPVSIVAPFASGRIPAGAWTLFSYSDEWFTVIDVTTDCILYRIDSNGDLVVDPQEQHGFRLSGDAVERYASGPHRCDDGTWVSLTDPAVIAVDTLGFSTSGDRLVANGGETGLVVREIGIEIAAHLRIDPFIARGVLTTVHPRANLFVPDRTP